MIFIEISQSGSHTNDVNFAGDSQLFDHSVLSKLLQLLRNRLNWNHEKLETQHYLKVFMRTAGLSIPTSMNHST